MVGTLTGLQWWIYDSFKVAVGLQASGGKWVFSVSLVNLVQPNPPLCQKVIPVGTF
jgi:hypothetical protein